MIVTNAKIVVQPRFNLPPVVDVPNGFNTLLEGYGKDGALKNSLGSSNRDPILVTW